MNKKILKAKEILEDIRGGLSDPALMEKFELSPKGLNNLFEKLVAAGVLTQSEVDFRRNPDQNAIEMNWKCPACGFPQRTQYTECPECGVIVEKFRAIKNSTTQKLSSAPGTIIHTTPPTAIYGTQLTGEHHFPTSPEDQTDQQELSQYGSVDQIDAEPDVLRMSRTEWLLLAGCPLAALLCFPFFWLRWTLETLRTLVHEMGHAIFGWTFGYPSFPAFDVVWGGGVTLHTGRSTALLVLIYFGFAALIWLYRKNRATLVLLTAVVFIHGLFTYTSIHSILILFMGHGTELIIAGIFIYRSLSGRTVVHGFERPLYGIIGFFIIFADISLSYNLLSSATFREIYASAKGGDIDMDFVRIAADYLHTSMTPVVIVFLACCLLSIVFSFLSFRYMEYIHSMVAILWSRDPEN